MRSRVLLCIGVGSSPRLFDVSARPLRAQSFCFATGSLTTSNVVREQQHSTACLSGFDK